MPLPRSLPQSSKQQKLAGRTLARRYRVEHRLGSGAFGTAFVVTDLQSHNDRKVLKQIGVGDLLPDETVYAVREARLLAKLDHPSIVKFHDSFLEKEFFCIVTELCEGGDLDQKIKESKESGRGFDVTLIVDWFIQLTTAIMYIHERRILHRDIKTRNIFLKKNLVKLGDFGISRILMGTTDLASTFTGTPHYMSPEALKQSGYNTKSDIWSLGVVLYEMCTLNRAFPGSNLMAVMYSIVEGEKPQLPATFTAGLRNLFDRMLEKDPCQRPSAVAILQDPFLQRKLESLRGKLSTHLTPTNADPHVSSPTSPSLPTSLAAEAQDIAKAIEPVKKKSLQATPGTKPLTPRQQLVHRKQQTADHEAEERRQLAAENFSEGKKRFSEHRRKQTKVIPPWVEEHPDVFNDPNFSLTQLSTGDCLNGGSQQQLGDGGDGREGVVRKVEGGGLMEGSRGGGEDQEGAGIPEDPSLAESHYSQFEDFEDISSSEDEYEALMECIEGALDLPNQPIPGSPPGSPSPHDELCPFSSQARAKKIKFLSSQCIAIYGEDLFHRIYSYLNEARSRSVPHGDEASVMAGLKLLTTNTRDCFLVDQLVFLEKQVQLL